jgi:lipid-binding SYLF domain-containing protein
MIKRTVTLLAIAVLLFAAPALADKRTEKKSKIDAAAQEALQDLFAKSDHANELFNRAYGYAVFDNFKIALVISGGGGAGVAVNKGSGARTYMKMGTVGLNVGLGGSKYQVVFLFETETAFSNFVNRGWQADAQASAAAGKASAEVSGNFHNGIAYFQMTEAGLMASADISGTKYWKSKKLND